MTDGQMIVVCCVLLPWPVAFVFALLVGRFLRAGGCKPVPEVREPVRECEFWERAS